MFRPGIPRPGAQGTHGARDAQGGEDQPRPVEGARQPTAAERARTLLETSVSAVLTVPGAEPAVGPLAPESSPLGHELVDARAITPEGDVVLLVPASSAAARGAVRARGDELAAVMEITDVAPVAVPHRVRGRAWVTGWLTAVPARERAACARLVAERQPAGPAAGVAWLLLRLEVGEAYVDDLWGAEAVEPDDFAAARADPLAPHETELLQHLAAHHRQELEGLSALLGERAPGPGDAAGGGVRPLSLDRHGFRVRCCLGGGGCVDARFEFPGPVEDVDGLRREMRRLFQAAGEEAREH